MIYYVTLPEVYRFEEHPTLKSGHPDGYVEVEAKDETKARKLANTALGSHWSVMYDDKHFDPEFFAAGCVGRIWKDKDKRVEMTTCA